MGITRLRNLLTNYTGVNLYIITRTKELDVMVDGHKVKALDISLENGILRAFYGYYIGMYPDDSIQVFRPEDFHSLYTLRI